MPSPSMSPFSKAPLCSPGFQMDGKRIIEVVTSNQITWEGIKALAHATSDPHLIASRRCCGKRPYRSTMRRFHVSSWLSGGRSLGELPIWWPEEDAERWEANLQGPPPLSAPSLMVKPIVSKTVELNSTISWFSSSTFLLFSCPSGIMSQQGE